MQQHMKVKELVAAAHAAATELPPATAKLMRDVASRLDVATVRGDALQQQVNALGAENVRIKICNDVLSEELRGYESDGAYPEPVAHKLWYSAEHPETDRLLAERDREIEARGVERFAIFCREKAEVRAFNFFNDAAINAEEFAAQLRAGEV